MDVLYDVEQRRVIAEEGRLYERLVYQQQEKQRYCLSNWCHKVEMATTLANVPFSGKCWGKEGQGQRNQRFKEFGDHAVVLRSNVCVAQRSLGVCGQRWWGGDAEVASQGHRGRVTRSGGAWEDAASAPSKMLSKQGTLHINYTCWLFVDRICTYPFLSFTTNCSTVRLPPTHTLFHKQASFISFFLFSVQCPLRFVLHLYHLPI